jgi:transcriptional regulator with XRE-family HTH domain
MVGLKIDLEKLRGAIKNKAALADRIGIGRASLYRKLNGEVKMTLDDLNEIAHLINRNAEDFIVRFDLSELADESTQKTG